MPHDFKQWPELTNHQMQFYYWESPHKQILEDFNAKVIRVKDGDTIQVQTDFRNFDFPVRLARIDAFELEEGGLAGAKWLASEILGEDVLILIDPKVRVGKFGRIIGDVIHMGRSMSDTSLELGYSVIFQREALPWD